MKVEYIIIHHTGAEEKDAAPVRRYHLSLGWRDVGYNYIIERDGQVVAGRSLDIPGAHCRDAGMNFKSAGVALIGNFMDHPPTPEQWQALIELVRELCHRYGVPPERVLGHNEVPGAATDCPGRFMDMGRVRREVGVALAGAGEKAASDEPVDAAAGKVVAQRGVVIQNGPGNVTAGEAEAPGKAVAGSGTVDAAAGDEFGSREAAQGGPTKVTGAGNSAGTGEAAHGRFAYVTMGAGDENNDTAPSEEGENPGMEGGEAPTAPAAPAGYVGESEFGSGAAGATAAPGGVEAEQAAGPDGQPGKPGPDVHGPAAAIPVGLWRVQVGAFAKKEKAEALAEKLKNEGYDVYIVEPSG